MSCGSCGKGENGQPAGCGNNGNCASGSCNKLNTYDWLTALDIQDPSGTDLVEVSFKKGAKKDFYINPPHTRTGTGDFVVVDTGNGYDVGRLTLSGDLVKLQMKKKKVRENKIHHEVVRKANEADLGKMNRARELEMPALVKARAIANTLGLEMKIGDVEYQADLRKATFYYTADGRVDFRELVRAYAREFRTKIEMRQIGARQESQRIGGIGSCGRELCCSTWLTDFKTVTTAAARYQNLAINQSKLSGQCGRLKCCLNYELDTYVDALKHFPKRADNLFTEMGKAVLIKTDIFKRLMYYSYETDRGRGILIALDVERVREVQEMNRNKQKPADLPGERILLNDDDGGEEESEITSDVSEGFELPEEKKKKKNKKGRRRGKSGRSRGNQKGTGGKGSRDSAKDSKGRSRRRKPSDNKGNFNQKDENR